MLLTVGQATMLKELLRSELKKKGINLDYHRIMIAAYWDRCDKSKNSLMNDLCFSQLNNNKNQARKLRDQMKVIRCYPGTGGTSMV